MIRIGLTIRNPFFKQNNFKNLYTTDGSITKNKHWEFEIIRDEWNWFEFTCSLECSGHDHAGPELTIGIGNYEIGMRIYDSRHWNIDTQDWEVYKDENRQETGC